MKNTNKIGWKRLQNKKHECDKDLKYVAITLGIVLVVLFVKWYMGW